VRACGRGLRPSAFPGRFLPSPRPPCRRGPCPCAGPLRGGAPANRFRGPGPGSAPVAALPRAGPRAFPPASSLGLCARCRAPWRSLPPSAFGPGLGPLRAPFGSPCGALRPWAVCSASARRVPPCPSALRLRARFAPGRGLSRPVGRVFARCAPGRFLARVLAPAALALAPFAGSAALWALLGFRVAHPGAPGFSPTAPPPLSPPPGARGERRAESAGLRAPNRCAVGSPGEQVGSACRRLLPAPSHCTRRPRVKPGSCAALGLPGVWSAPQGRKEATR